MYEASMVFDGAGSVDNVQYAVMSWFSFNTTDTIAWDQNTPWTSNEYWLFNRSTVISQQIEIGIKTTMEASSHHEDFFRKTRISKWERLLVDSTINSTGIRTHELREYIDL